jgi:predicted Zn-dependent protease with MMP-like domain
MTARLEPIGASAELSSCRVPLNAIITHVLVHEIGHHFGLSDEDMRVIEGRE